MQQLPYFEIGAARSGTKILRDTLEAHPELSTSNYPLDDEIWSYGQQDATHDAYTPETLTDDIKTTIRNRFQNRMPPSKRFIEKNVNHSLRIPYITRVFPNTKFIHIIRDGRDAVRSAREMWKNPVDWTYYITDKGWELSPGTIVYYLWKLGSKWMKRLITGRKHLDYWGIHIPDLDHMVEERPLTEVCALQWQSAVDKAREDAQRLDDDQYFELQYETLMTTPDEVLPDLADFLGLESSRPMLEYAQAHYRTSSIGQWNQELTDSTIKRLDDIIGETLNELGYK